MMLWQSERENSSDSIDDFHCSERENVSHLQFSFWDLGDKILSLYVSWRLKDFERFQIHHSMACKNSKCFKLVGVLIYVYFR